MNGYVLQHTGAEVDQATEAWLDVQDAQNGLLYKNGQNTVTTKDLVNTLDNNPNHVPTSHAVADAIAEAGGGDMTKTQYDPGNVVYNAGGIPGFVETRLTNMIIGIDDNGVYVKYAI